ncbi:ABC transporter substrate-binding protein [Cohnella thailandensis]|uniref:ABC transporter substrate-binding protein n=1 Tax=Cohnella thailandensis TaxID=557557 RepID=A0A841T4Y8_9BACL|nr:ABC transporter substrate-binding protein [Cohnella thailandensis]MBB6637150.1 ABC transporter substrate-binding protein [Cohnella thailandensis]MBP1977032.1 putative aldouronate transport system substrate-binding protein [Cohnella thailandensis]
MKGKMKPIIAVLIAILTLSMLAACSSNNENNSGSSPSGSPSSGGASEQPSGNANDAIKDPYELTMALPVFGAVPPDLAEVQAEINKITQAQINTTVTILPISIGTWTQQMNLMMSSGEKLDLAYTFGQMYDSTVASGQILPLDDLLDKYGQGAVEAVGADYLKAASLKGNVYGVPITGAYANKSGVYMRKDLVEKYNIDLASIHTMADLEPVFQTIKDNEPGMVPIGSGLVSPLEYDRFYDRMGDRYGVLPGYDNGLKLVNLYETPEYANQVNLMHKWFKAGFINKDAATTKTTSEDMVKSGKAFAYFMASKPSMLAEETKLVGRELVEVDLQQDAYSTTSDILIGLWTIAQQSENPERAMMLLNLLYTNSDLANLFAWGIEGKHYVKNSDGQIEYPSGVDSQSVGYNITSLTVANKLITHIFKGNESDLWDQIKAFNASASKSKALGFAFDSSSVKNEITALNNVIEQYQKIIETGTVDPADKLEEFQKKLKTAGIDKVIAEKQKQLDAWAAQKSQ